MTSAPSIAEKPRSPDVAALAAPENSRLFTRWENPANGVASYILTERPAPVQQSFYYTHPSYTEDGRYLWLGCGFPPPGGKYSQQVLGVVDFTRDEMRVYPETQFPSSRPVVDLGTGEAYWANNLQIWKRGPFAEDSAKRINCFPAELATGDLESLATHPTFSADRQTLSIDARFQKPDGSRIVHIGELPLDGSPFRLWATLDGIHNHGLFSPTDPEVQIFSHEYWKDHAAEPFDGSRPYHRTWVVRKGEEPRPLLKRPISHSGHEWWDADGEHVWFLHYGVGVIKVNVATGEETMKWAGALSHGHSDRSGRYVVADRMDDPKVSDCNVLFRDTLTGREVEIVNRGPLNANFTQCEHLHPHPQFCLGDRYICYTTTVCDRVDVALAPTADLILRTA